MSHVQQMATLKNVPPDWGYVYNFQDPSQPEPISLPCGHMRVLAADMNELVDTVRRDVPKVFESNDYTERMEAAMQRLQERRQEVTDALERSAIEAGFTLRSTPAGITPGPCQGRSAPIRGGVHYRRMHRGAHRYPGGRTTRKGSVPWRDRA